MDVEHGFIVVRFLRVEGGSAGTLKVSVVVVVVEEGVFGETFEEGTEVGRRVRFEESGGEEGAKVGRPFETGGVDNP